MAFELYSQAWLDDFTVVTMLARLEADVNGDGAVDLNDVRAIQVMILANMVNP